MTADEGVDYFRGAGGVRVDGRRVASILVGLAALTLAVLVVILGVVGYQQNSRSDRLRQHGVPVAVTVTGCLGIASGTGITESAYRCRGSFMLDGRSYNEVIGGSSTLLSIGQRVQAKAVRDDPSIMATTESVMRSGSSWTAYATPLILLVLLIPTAGLWRRLSWSGSSSR